MSKQKHFEAILEEDLVAERVRPVFLPNGSGAQSWVGDWENNSADLARQVAREFQRWFECQQPVRSSVK